VGYDIIGDIHGHADPLKALLRQLGYRDRGGAWRHSQRQAIFVGDFIDRGPKQVEAVDIVRRMVEAGSAFAIMGNHEFNAIGWFQPDPDQDGEFLRPHFSTKYGEKNVSQHVAFLAEVIGTPRHAEIIDWFRTLPLWLELPGLRVIHACWHPRYIEYLAPHLTAERRLTNALMVSASRGPENEVEKDTLEPTPFKAVDALLKGIEMPLPPPHTFKDKDGNERSRARVRWWDSQPVTYRDAAMLPEEHRERLPCDPIPEHLRLGHDGGKPTFIGHYCLTGRPQLLSDKVACVDYNIARGGRLVAYRWDGESMLNDVRFHCVGA